MLKLILVEAAPLVGAARRVLAASPSPRAADSRSPNALHGYAGYPSSGGIKRSRGATLEAAVVATVTVTAVADDQIDPTIEGETVHVARDGAPVQLKLIVALKPGVAVRFRL
jgi:hypothetical protein